MCIIIGIRGKLGPYLHTNMSERASERTRAAESEEVSEPAGGENVSRAENRRKRKTRSFGVESKSFELEMEERRAKTLMSITESK